MSFECFLDFNCDSIGKDAFTGSKLNVNELRRNELVLIRFFCDKFRLHMVISALLQILLFTARDHSDSICLWVGLNIESDYCFNDCINSLIVDLWKCWYVNLMCLFVPFICFIDVLRKPLTFFFLLFSHYFGTIQKVFFVLLLGNKEPFFKGTFNFFV